MHPNIEQVLDLLEQLAPKRLAEEWDNPGLQLGGLFDPVQKILLSLDPTLEAVQVAANLEAQLLLTHHPLILNPIKSIERNSYPGKVIWEAINNKIAVISAHTNLDAAQKGINDQLALALHLSGARPLEIDENQDTGEGIGRIGRLGEPLRLSSLVRKVKEALKISSVRVVGQADRMVLNVAVVGGSGGSLIETASRAHADVLITGDIGHHHALTARDIGLAVIDAGHYETEKAALNIFNDHLSSRLKALNWTVEVVVYGEEESPIRYE
jgi:dinuclear metal center YbgI/SA1388 family protein